MLMRIRFFGGLGLVIPFILFFFSLSNSAMAKGEVTKLETEESSNKLRKSLSVIDLEAIKKRGSLRILVPSNLDGGQFLPRFGSPVNQQQQIAQDFAKSMGLEAEVIPVFSIRDMLSSLLSGKGDLIAANITITEKRKKMMAFTVPLEHVQEVVLVNVDNTDIKSPKDLSNKRLLVHKSTSFWESAKKLKKSYPDMRILEQNKYLQDEEALDLVADGEYDATIRDSNVAKMYLSYRDDIKVAFALKGDDAIAWAVRPDSTELKEALDQYLTKVKLSSVHNEKLFGDLAEIKKRGFIRILLRNNASSYFFWKGQLMGFEYEMAKAYADHLGVKLSVIVPPENSQMLAWIKEGKADIAAGFLTPSKEWAKYFISATVPYHKAAHHLVVQKKNDKIKTSDDLAGVTIVVHKASIYWKVLDDLKKSGVQLTLQAAPEEMEIEEILEKVAEGEYEATMVDEHLLDIELGAGIAVKSAIKFGKEYEHALAVREENTDLLADLNEYISSNKDGKLYARLYKKYFNNSKSIARLQRARLKEINGKKNLSAYDKYVKSYSEKYGFDWRLITAQMFSESRFRPSIRSSAGAIGLMQVMSSTGKQLNLRKLFDPETNIHAGIKYMHWLTQRFDNELPVADRMWFTLASYNAGLGHVLDARRLAARLGLNKNRWFGNVEKAMLLLSKKSYYSKARYGYVRGREPVSYVKKIKELYENYINVVGTEQVTNT